MASARGALRGSRASRLEPQVEAADEALRAWEPTEASVEAVREWVADPGSLGRDPSRQAITINPARWKAVARQDWPERFDAVESRLQVSRADLLDLAEDCRQHGRWVPLLVASYAWGWGLSGFGPFRLARVFGGQPDRVNESLKAAVEALTAGGAALAYETLKHEHAVPGLGPAFFTKFLYFAGWDHPDVSGPRPLILDRWVAWSLQQLSRDVYTQAGVDADMPKYLWGPHGWSPHRYGEYLHFAHRVAPLLASRVAGLADRPDVVELALFRGVLRGDH